MMVSDGCQYLLRDIQTQTQTLSQRSFKYLGALLPCLVVRVLDSVVFFTSRQ